MATITNLTMVATKMDVMRKANRQAASFLRLFYPLLSAIAKAFDVGLMGSYRQSIQSALFRK